MCIARSTLLSIVVAAAAVGCTRDPSRTTAPTTTARGADVGNPTDTSGGFSSDASSNRPTTGSGMSPDPDQPGTGTNTGTVTTPAGGGR